MSLNQKKLSQQYNFFIHNLISQMLSFDATYLQYQIEETQKMIAKSKQFKIERKKLVIHRQQPTKDEQNKQNKNCNPKPHRVYSRQKKISLIENIEHFQSKSVKKIISSKSIQKNSNTNLINKNNKENRQIFNNKETDEIHQEPSQKIQLIGRNAALNAIIRDFIQKLKQKKLLFQCHINSYLIEKDYFVHIVQYLISILSTNDTLQCNRLFHKLSQLKPTFQSISKYIFASKIKQKHNCLSLHSNVYYEQYRHESYESSLEEGRKILSNVLLLNEQAKVKKIYNRQLSSQINNKRIIIDELNRKQEQLGKSIKDKEKELQKLESLIKKFDSFAADNVQIIKTISRQFKQAQNNFHTFISSFQSNSFLSFLDLQKHPSQQKNIQNNQDNNQVLRQCIIHLRSWMINWNIKQQILTNLKKQFASDNEKIYQQLHQTNKINKDDAIYKTFIQIRNIYAKIEQNYKLSNLFY